MFVCLAGFLTSSSITRSISWTGPKTERLTILRAATHETELGDHDFCLSRSHRYVTYHRVAEFQRRLLHPELGLKA